MLCNSRRCFYKSRSDTTGFDEVRYAECDEIWRRLINKTSLTIYCQVASNQYQLFMYTKSYFLQLILPLLSYNSWIQCPYHVRLECQVRCYIIQEDVFISQVVRRQLLINTIFEGDWTPIVAANTFFVPNTEEFFECLVALLQWCGDYVVKRIPSASWFMETVFWIT